MANNQSTIARQRIARENEHLVIAENALEFERIVSRVRLAAIAIISLGSGVARRLEGLPKPHPDPRRVVAVGLYWLFAIGAIALLRRARPNLRNALRGELIFTLVDFAFMTFMGIGTAAMEGTATPERGAAIFALLMCFSVGRVSSLHVVVSCLLACACYALVGHVDHAWRPTSGFFVLGCFVALGILLLAMQRRIRRMFVDLRKRDNLMSFLPRQVAERLLTGGENALAPVQREVTVLFSDIRDFTALSESLEPGAVLAFLDEYFGHMGHLVKEHEGIVNKFLGDGMLAFWGVPEASPDHAELALKAALDMRKVVGELNAVRRQHGAPPIRIGIGIHTGVVAAGMLGGADQHEYTVIGDAVNVASRVEGLTKELGADILVSESTWRLVGERFKGQRISEQRVKGRQEGVVVYALEARLPKPDEGGEADAA